MSSRENQLVPRGAMLGPQGVGFRVATPKKCLFYGVFKALERAFLVQHNQKLNYADRPTLYSKVFSCLNICENRWKRSLNCDV